MVWSEAIPINRCVCGMGIAPLHPSYENFPRLPATPHAGIQDCVGADSVRDHLPAALFVPT